MRHSRIAALLLGSALLSAPALADESLVAALTMPNAAPNHWYGDVSGGVRVQNIPDIDLLWASSPDTAAFTSEPSIVMGGGSLSLGHVFGKQLDPQIWGGRAHVTLNAHYYVGSGDESFFFDDPVSIISTDGTAYSLYSPITTDVHTRFQDWGASLRGGLDFDQGGGFYLTPSVAFFGGHTHLSQQIDILEDDGAAPPYYADRMQSDVRNTRLGGAIGLGGTYDMGGFMLRGGAQVSLTYNQTKALVSNCASTATSDPAVCDGGALLEENVAYEDNGFGVVVGGGLGVSFDIGFGTLAIDGQVNYDSYIPTVDYGNTETVPTKLASDGAFSYGGGITVTIPLN